MCRHGPFWKVHLFRKFEENIIFPCIFFRKIIFVFCLRYKIIFLGKRNILFPDNTRKIIFQSNFLERLSFQNVWKKKIWFSVQCRGPKLVYKEGVEALSNYKKHYWWFGDPACCDPSFSSRTEKDQAHAPPRHVWGKKEEGEVWFSVCEVPLDDWDNGGYVDFFLMCREYGFSSLESWSWKGCRIYWQKSCWIVLGKWDVSRVIL